MGIDSLEFETHLLYCPYDQVDERLQDHASYAINHDLVSCVVPRKESSSAFGHLSL